MLDYPLNTGAFNQYDITGSSIDSNPISKKSRGLRLKRNAFLFALAKGIAWSYIKPTSHKHHEIPLETLELLKHQYKYKDCSIYFVAPHKSLWETLGIPYAISWNNGDVPFIMMGNNLIKKEDGRLENMLRYMMDRSGIVLVEREDNPRAASPVMVSNISRILKYNRNLLIFAEGTRSRNGLMKDFKPAGFQGLVDAVSTGAKSYIVPVNVDYSHLIELGKFASEIEIDKLTPIILSEEFSSLNKVDKLRSLRNLSNSINFVDSNTLEEFSKFATGAFSDKADYLVKLEKFKEKYTFKVKDSKNWRINIGNVYVSFGKPMPVNTDYNRKYLAKISNELCLDLVKIQPINVLSEAIVRINPQFGDPINNRELYTSIDNVIMDLLPYETKFRDFTALTKSSEIIKKADIVISSEFIEGYKIYVNNISHYLPKK